LRVLITGATGVLGRRLVRLLTKCGQDVIGLSRSDHGDETIRALGGTPKRANLFNPDELTEAARECDVVVHGATAIPTRQRPRNSDWRMNDRIRVEGTRALVEVSERVEVEQFIFPSVVWVARPEDQSPFDESFPLNPDSVTASAATAERIALEAAERLRFTTTVLRAGWFYAPDAAHTRSFGDALRKRMLPIVGSGEAYWSMLHVDDAAAACLAAIESRPAGVFHIVDDQPVQTGQFFRHFADRLGALPPRRIPVWLARLLAGEFAAGFATTSTITSAELFKRETGWKPAFPSYREGIEQVVSDWEWGTG
jgi:2-alkyl-3-oxoalkanoate reductase